VVTWSLATGRPTKAISVGSPGDPKYPFRGARLPGPTRDPLILPPRAFAQAGLPTPAPEAGRVGGGPPRGPPCHSPPGPAPRAARAGQAGRSDGPGGTEAPAAGGVDGAAGAAGREPKAGGGGRRAGIAAAVRRQPGRLPARGAVVEKNCHRRVHKYGGNPLLPLRLADGQVARPVAA